MSITYPLTPPTSQYVSQQWSILRGTGLSESPFTGVQQTVEFSYAKVESRSLSPSYEKVFYKLLHG